MSREQDEESKNLNHVLAAMQSIDNLFFSKQRGLARDFGLTIFPFFTFFDSLLERLEIDLKQQYQKSYMVRRWFYRPKSDHIDEVLGLLYKAIKEQWEGVQRDAADRFVERFSELHKMLIELEEVLPEMFHLRFEQFRSEFYMIVAQFFVINHEAWQDAALSQMGGVLGQRAQRALPPYEHLASHIKRLSGRNFEQDVEFLLQEERIEFHQNLQQKLSQLYQDVYLAMEKCWRSFYQEYQEHVAGINTVDN